METPNDSEKIETIAFYNIENLFDIEDDKTKHDNDFLPGSKKRWTKKRYEKKLIKIGYAITQIGFKETQSHPLIVGLAEVENAKVLSDLIASKHLKPLPYKFVHFDSKDERGIDVALLYDSTHFNPTHSQTFQVELTDTDGSPDYTRDILLVSGQLKGVAIHVIVNHWPSKRDGDAETAHKRLAASKKVIEIISHLKEKHPNDKLIIMGDFNDDPSSASIKQLEQAHNLFNPMKTLMSFNRGTSSHNRRWNLFDQILISTNFFENNINSFEFVDANIFDEDFLKLDEGRYKGNPFRTYVGKRYKGGFSDHFPVYITLKK